MAQPFRFGVVTGNAQSRKEWVMLAKRVEELGYSTLLVIDRVMSGLAPLTALAVAAEATTTLRIGSFVFCNDFRHPAVLAKEVATLDLLSEGRFELGLGSGVGGPDYRQMGMTLDGPGTRVSRMDEALQIIKRLFTEEVVNFSGQHYTITEMRGLPKPLQKPHPPIFIGSSGKRGLSIAGREANSIAITPRWLERGVDPADATPEAIKQKIAWVQEAAGERFSAIEFSQTAYYITVTDGPTSNTQSEGPPIPKIPMSIEQTIEHLVAQRANYGNSYIQVTEGQMENFAPVVAQLAGK